jgi:hypothetical protein
VTARILVRALRGEPKSDVLLADADHPPLADRIAAIGWGNYRGKPAAEIHGTALYSMKSRGRAVGIRFNGKFSGCHSLGGKPP